jgi:hypothetical protein
MTPMDKAMLIFLAIMINGFTFALTCSPDSIIRLYQTIHENIFFILSNIITIRFYLSLNKKLNS